VNRERRRLLPFRRQKGVLKIVLGHYREIEERKLKAGLSHTETLLVHRDVVREKDAQKESEM